MSDEQYLRTLLRAEIVDAPPPSRIINVPTAVGRARRHRLQRRLAGVLAIVSLVGVATVGILAVSRADGNRQPQVAPVFFDPLVRSFDVGWLPDGFTARWQDTTTTKQSLTLDGPPQRAITESPNPTSTGVFPPSYSSVDIELYPAQRTPYVQNVAGAAPTATLGPSGWALDTLAWPPPGSEPGPAIGGSPSWWKADERRTMLAWQWAPGAWAVVIGRDLDRDPVARIAQELRTGVQIRVRVPFTVARPPADLGLVGVMVTLSTGGPAWRLTPNAGSYAFLTFSDRNDVPESDTWVRRSVHIGIGRGSVYDDKLELPNTQINGYPAIDHSSTESRHIRYDTANGYLVTVFVHKNLLPVVTHDAALAWVAGVQLAADPNDQSQWTDTPVRPGT